MKPAFFAPVAAALAIVSGINSPAFAQAKPTTQHFLPDVKITQCFVTQPKMMSKRASGTQIVYRNTGRHTYSSVTFVVGYRNSDSRYIRKVTDQGTFAPGTVIDHHFTLYNDVTFGGKSTQLCGALAAAR